MPRYYFHLRSDLDARDEEGAELPDMEAARARAMESVREIVCADIRLGFLNPDHAIEVTDRDGAVLFTVTFQEAFEVRRRS